MKIRMLVCCVLLMSQLLLSAQGHEAVFPDLDGQDLEEAVMDNFTPASVQSYGVARDILFGTIDKVNDSLRCVYTDWPVYIPPGADPTQAAFQDGQGLNTEHGWPRGHGADLDPARANMHHLFPSRVDVNQARGNLPFGEISDVLTDSWFYLNQELSNAPSSNRNAYSEYRENVAFEPREAVKGDIARAMMYFYTIYRSEANAASPGFFSSQRATLCQWHEQDPVDAKEWDRTQAIAFYQDNKANPFVLDCTLAARTYCPELIGNSCITSSEEAVLQTLSASFSPNPTSGRGLLTVTTEEAGTLWVQCYDQLGRRVQLQEIMLSTGTFELALNMPGPGLWFCELRQETSNKQYLQWLPIVVVE